MLPLPGGGIVASSLSHAIKAISSSLMRFFYWDWGPCVFGTGSKRGLWSPQAYILKGLILAQNERWRRGLGMQVERIPWGLLQGGSGERGSKAWVTYPGDEDSLPNGRVILGDLATRHLVARK
jgi:hypothetical protein